MFGSTLPSYGLYVRHVDSLQLTNVCFNWDDSDARPGIIMDDVTNTPAYVVAGSNGGCVQLASGVEEHESLTSFWVDVNDIFHCPNATSGMTLEVCNSLGQIVLSKAKVKLTEDFSMLESGVYVAVLSDGQNVSSIKFVR
jgi:hypothetical protein